VENVVEPHEMTLYYEEANKGGFDVDGALRDSSFMNDCVCFILLVI